MTTLPETRPVTTLEEDPLPRILDILEKWRNGGVTEHTPAGLAILQGLEASRMAGHLSLGGSAELAV